MQKEKNPTELISESLLEHELQGPNFLTYVSRPKYTEQIETFSDLSPDGGEGCAIIVSGPMIYENHFTRDSIRLYRKHYPNALIILSTWEDEECEYLEDLEDEKTFILRNRKPSSSDDLAFELAVRPVEAGVKEAARLNTSHVLHISNVCRIYAVNIMDYFKSLLDAFPLQSAIEQRQRIVASSYGSLKYMPFCVSPIFTFGHIDDMLDYWMHVSNEGISAPTDKAPISVPAQAGNSIAFRLTRSFLNKKDVPFANTIADSWRVMVNYFCLVDLEMLDLFWHEPAPSAQHGIERCSNGSYTMTPRNMMTFRDWLILYQRRDSMIPAPEFIVDLHTGVQIDKTQYEDWRKKAYAI